MPASACLTCTIPHADEGASRGRRPAAARWRARHARHAALGPAIPQALQQVHSRAQRGGSSERRQPQEAPAAPSRR